MDERILIKFIKKKVKWSHYRSGVAQRVGTGLALLFHDRGTRGWWVVSGTLRPHFTSGKDPVPIFREAGWAPRSVWTGGKSRPYWNSIPNRPPRSQSLYRLSYTAHFIKFIIHTLIRNTFVVCIEIFSLANIHVNVTTWYTQTATHQLLLSAPPLHLCIMYCNKTGKARRT